MRSLLLRVMKTAEDALQRAISASGSSTPAFNALFGNGLAGDVVTSVNDPAFGGVRNTYKSWTLNPGVTVTLAFPNHALILRVQDKITIAGTIDGRHVVDADDNLNDILVGEQFTSDGGGSGGGGGGQNTQGSPGQTGGSGKPIFANIPLAASYPIQFGSPGIGGVGGGGLGGDGANALPSIPDGYDPLGIAKFMSAFGWANIVIAGAAGLNGGPGVDGGHGGQGSGPGGVGGVGGAAANGGDGGALIYLICPEIEIMSTASILTDASAGVAGVNGTAGAAAGVGTDDGGGGGGSGGGGGGGGNAGPIVFVTQKLIIHPGATISALGGAGGTGGIGGAGGAGDGAGFAGGRGGDGSTGVDGFDWPNSYTFVRL